MYVIRAAAIDDKALMQAVSEAELSAFFLYVKELNFLVCDARARAAGELRTVVTANDLSGSSGLDKRFQAALSGSSKTAAKLYPALGGPTLLLNLPKLLALLVKLLQPLFPKTVQKKIRFESGPLADVADLRELRDAPTRAPRRDYALLA